MLNLLLKDIIIQKKALLFYVGYALFMFLIFSQPMFSNAVYITISSAIAYMLVLNVFTIEDKYKTDILLNSLPISRTKIVIAKYLNVFVFVIIANIISGVLGMIIKLINLPINIAYISSFDILITLLTISLLCSVYYPIASKFNIVAVRLVNVIMFMLAFFVPANLVTYIKTNPQAPLVQTILNIFSSYSPSFFVIHSLLFIVIILLISFVLTLKIYQNKEF